MLAQGIEEAHAKGKLFFLASNIAAHNNKLKTYIRDLEPIIGMGPDALIMSDPGLIMMVRERWPDLPIHLSVQSNVVNYAGVKFWQSFGLEAHHPVPRVVIEGSRRNPRGMPWT